MMEKTKIRKDLHEIPRFFKLIRPYWRFITEALGVGIVITLLGIPGPYLTKILIDEVFLSKNKQLLLAVVLGILGITVFRELISVLRNYFVLHTQTQMALDMQLKFYKHLQKMAFKFYDSRKTGEILSRFRDASASLQMTVGLINRIIMSSLSLLIFPGILFYIHWKLAFLSLLVFPIKQVYLRG